MGSLSKRIVRKVSEPEEKKGFTDFVQERPLDLIVRRLHRRIGNATRTRKARKQ